jgi:predicted kinase
LRTDVLRKQHFAINETDRLPGHAYQPEATAKIYELLVQRALRILVQGRSVIVDAVFARESERAAIRNAARTLNARFVGLFLQTDLATRLNRVGSRVGDASDATPEIAVLQENYDIGPIDWTIIDASGTPEQTLKRCQAMFSRPETTQPS